MQAHVMKIDISEAKHSFRVNKITLAKRHLRSVFPKETDKPDDKILAMYLTVVPAVKDIEPHPNQSEGVRYGIIKARKLVLALGLNEDNTVPFIIAMRSQVEEGDKNPFHEGQEAKAPTLH